MNFRIPIWLYHINLSSYYQPSPPQSFSCSCWPQVHQYMGRTFSDPYKPIIMGRLSVSGSTYLGNVSVQLLSMSGNTATLAVCRAGTACFANIAPGIVVNPQNGGLSPPPSSPPPPTMVPPPPPGTIAVDPHKLDSPPPPPPSPSIMPPPPPPPAYTPPSVPILTFTAVSPFSPISCPQYVAALSLHLGQLSLLPLFPTGGVDASMCTSWGPNKLVIQVSGCGWGERGSEPVRHNPH